MPFFPKHSCPLCSCNLESLSAASGHIPVLPSPNCISFARPSGISAIRSDVSPFSAPKWHFLLPSLLHGYVHTSLIRPSGLTAKKRKPFFSRLTCPLYLYSTVSEPCGPAVNIEVIPGDPAGLASPPAFGQSAWTLAEVRPLWSGSPAHSQRGQRPNRL